MRNRTIFMPSLQTSIRWPRRKCFEDRVGNAGLEARAQPSFPAGNGGEFALILNLVGIAVLFYSFQATSCFRGFCLGHCKKSIHRRWPDNSVRLVRNYTLSRRIRFPQAPLITPLIVTDRLDTELTRKMEVAEVAKLKTLDRKGIELVPKVERPKKTKASSANPSKTATKK